MNGCISGDETDSSALLEVRHFSTSKSGVVPYVGGGSVYVLLTLSNEPKNITKKL